ncbi:MAG: hypothetical protein AAF433_01685 [Bacteroidota bacterium]
MYFSRLTTLLFLLGLFMICPDAEAQRNNRRNRSSSSTEAWPPERAYSRLSLGSALQQVFAKHYEFCGFPAASGRRRDYTPPSLERFLGRRDLRTRVEQADINGGLLMNYIFSAEETAYPLDEIRFRPDHVLQLQQQQTPFLPQAKEGFDAFVMTKNCSGYLNACLEAGIEPPYAAFRAALASDDRRESSVLALAGSFSSPLREIIAANDTRTHELMARLWLFYQEHPELNGQAYYLHEFEGMIVQHLSTANDIYTMEQQFGVNVNLPFAARFKAEASRGRTAATTFEGTDWQTIVYTDFNPAYQREGFFERLPSSTEIESYFQYLSSANQPATEKLVRELAPFQHSFKFPGLPSAMAGLDWSISNLEGSLYRGMPELKVVPYQEADGSFGLEMQLNGIPNSQGFHRDPMAASTADIRCTFTVYGRDYNQLSFTSSANFSRSFQPLISSHTQRFDLQRQDDQNYSCSWEIELNIDDWEHPCDYYSGASLVQNVVKVDSLHLWHESTEIQERRHQFILRLETRESWPLSKIDISQMTSRQLPLEIYLPTEDGIGAVTRTLIVNLALPSIISDLPLALPQLPAIIDSSGLKIPRN